MGPRARSQRATEAFSSALTQPHITTCNGFSSNKYAALSARAACCERARASMRHAAQECGTLLYIILWQTPQFLCGSKRWHTPCNNSRTSLPVNPQPNARSRISCVSDMLHTWAPAKGQSGGKRTKDNRETPCGLQSCSKIRVFQTIQQHTPAPRGWDRVSTCMGKEVGAQLRFMCTCCCCARRRAGAGPAEETYPYVNQQGEMGVQ